MKLHNTLQNEDCIGQKVTADIPVGLEWVDYPENYIGGVISSAGVEVRVPNNDYRDVYVEDGLLAFCQGETCEIKAFNEKEMTVTLLNNDPKRSLAVSGDNATVFTIPYKWYTACFGSDWPIIAVNTNTLNIDTEQRKSEEMKPSVLKKIRNNKQKSRQPRTKTGNKNRANDER